jgi:hypothetical protein
MVVVMVTNHFQERRITSLVINMTTITKCGKQLNESTRLLALAAVIHGRLCSVATFRSISCAKWASLVLEPSLSKNGIGET